VNGRSDDEKIEITALVIGVDRRLR